MQARCLYQFCRRRVSEGRKGSKMRTHRVGFVLVQSPGHPINRVFEKSNAVRIQLVVSSDENVFNGSFFEHESFLVMLGHFGRYET